MCRSKYKKGKTTHTVSWSQNGRTSWRNIFSLTDVLTSPITMTGGLKPEYYIRKRILIFLNFWPISKLCKNDPYRVPSFLVLHFLIFFAHLSDFDSPMSKLSKSERWAKSLLWWCRSRIPTAKWAIQINKTVGLCVTKWI